MENQSDKQVFRSRISILLIVSVFVAFISVSICGWSVNIADILSVERSYNPVSAPAASLKRLRIDFSKRKKYSYLLISPAREQAFIKALKKVNPNLCVHLPEKKGIWRIQDWDI